MLVVSVPEMMDWVKRILHEWDTPLVRAMRDGAVRTAAKYGKPAFGERVRQVIGFLPDVSAGAKQAAVRESAYSPASSSTA